MRDILNRWLGPDAPKSRQAVGTGAIVLVLISFGLLASVSDEVGGVGGRVLGLALGLVLVLGAAALYLIPAYIARKKPNATTVLVINIFFGWTFVGWVVALAMAVSNPTPSAAQTLVAQPSSQPEPTGRTPTAGRLLGDPVGAARTAVGDEAVDNALAEGETMDLDTAIAHASGNS